MYVWYLYVHIYVHIVDKKLQNYSLQLIEFKESDWPFCSTIFISIICFLMVIHLYVLVSFLLSLYAEPPILISTFIRYTSTTSIMCLDICNLNGFSGYIAILLLYFYTYIVLYRCHARSNGYF